MGQDIYVGPLIHQLENGDSHEKEEAAVEIAKAAENGAESVKRAISPLQEALHSEDPPRLRGKAASALAEISREYPDQVNEDDRLVELLKDGERFNQLNGILAVTAQGIDDAVDEIERLISNTEHRKVWAAAKLSSHAISSSSPVTIDYEHVKIIVSGGVVTLADQLDNDGVTQRSRDYAAAAILLDDRLPKDHQNRLRDVLLQATEEHPEFLHSVVPLLGERLSTAGDRSAEYIMWVLREYAKEYPERVTDLIDDVDVYLSNSHGFENPGNPTGFLAQVAQVEPRTVAKYKEDIKKLQTHDEDYVREYCETILNQIEGIDPEGEEITSKPERRETFSAEIDRISGSGNGIIELDDGHINLGPVTEDSVGEVVEAEMIYGHLARCKTESVKTYDYEAQFEELKPDKSPRPTGPPQPPIGGGPIVAPGSNKNGGEVTIEGRVEFCEECGSMMRGDGNLWVCSSCGFEKPKSSDSDSSSQGNSSSETSSSTSQPTQTDTVSSTQTESESSTDDSGVATDIEELRKKAEESAVEEVPEEASTTTQTTPEYTRSQAVVEYVKSRADGTCEGCGEPAPFTSKTGDPYLHAHHIHELSEGGSDTPDTVIALCPNCHYRVHHGEDGKKYNQTLLNKVQNIEG